MKYWLIIFLFTPEGEYTGKYVYPTSSKEACYQKAGRVTRPLVNSQYKVKFYCVTDDHYTGRKQDPGVPYD
jgi:superfamily II DNA or RNA helicase